MTGHGTAVVQESVADVLLYDLADVPGRVTRVV